MKPTHQIKIVCLYLVWTVFVASTSAKTTSVEKSTETSNVIEKDGIKSIDTKYTISKVRIAKKNGQNYIVASSFEGKLLGIDYNGKTLWENELSGFMNQDIWMQDITGDGNDEVLAANADGHIYCLNENGKMLWSFKQNDAPMYTVCVIQKYGTPYVVCGGFDKNVYYLSAKGELVQTLKSSTYSKEKFGKTDGKPKTHIANFLRVVKQANGSEHLLIATAVNSMQHKGAVYFFEPLAEKPYKRIVLKNKKPIGDFRVSDYFGNGKEEILAGSSAILADIKLIRYQFATQKNQAFETKKYRQELGKNAYLVTQTTIIPQGETYQYFTMVGSRIMLVANDFKTMDEILVNKYAYNDMWHDTKNNKIVLGSVQSGGSCIHIIDYKNEKWKSGFENLEPHGKIKSILANTAAIKKDLQTFKAPKWERKPKPIYFVSDLSVKKNGKSFPHPVVENINTNYDSPIFLGFKYFATAQDPNSWSRDTMSNKFYRERRDRRKKYIMTEKSMLENTTSIFDEHKGLTMWGGHGNDPFYYSPSTKKKIIDAADGKKMVFIFPELENHSKDFKYVLDAMLYPLAEYGEDKNLNIHLRCKHIFWQAPAYMPMWSRLQSGEFADVFVPTMEETSDKSMDLSVAGRMGYWLGGSVNQWGTRAIMDNASYDRLRQFSSQKLPNHGMRQIIYAAASGATHFNNFPVDQDYFSVVWDLIAKGTLYVPNRDELLSISPVHLSMTTPDHHYLESAEVKSTIKFDQKEEDKNKMVFSRLNGSWSAAPVTEWDFSNYAANETERRLNFIPAYNNGLVIITPVQNGALAKQNEPRGKLADKLHPLYKNILKEYITDGRNYISKDGKQTFPAETYYRTIKADIEKSAKLLPLTVSGDVGWVVAQTNEKHLRLTLVDGGYINPSDKEITVTFNTVQPVKMTDLLNGESFDLKNTKAVKVKIPCGSYRFIDIELANILSSAGTEVETKTPKFLPLSDPKNTGSWAYKENISDEFQDGKLDEEKWNIQGKDGKYSSNFHGRPPSQFSTKNVRIEDGKLKIQTRWQPDYPFSPTHHRKTGDAFENVTTAAVIGKNHFKYGYMEIKCKAANAPVTSSFWTTTQKGEAHASELDMFEMFGGHKKNAKWRKRLKFNIISWDAKNPYHKPTYKNGVYEDKIQVEHNTADDFHVYGFEWTADYIKVYVDGVLHPQGTITKKALTENGTDNNKWITDVPYKIWFDSETFPWLGLPEEADLPADFEIEYVRIWQK